MSDMEEGELPDTDHVDFPIPDPADDDVRVRRGVHHWKRGNSFGAGAANSGLQVTFNNSERDLPVRS